MCTYYPDGWVVLKITTDKEVFYKVMACWRSSYTEGESWRMNSGIVAAYTSDKEISFIGRTGSRYICRAGSYGISYYARGILERLIGSGIGKVELMPKDTDWVNLKYA